jgi:hypothetical protein
MKVGITVIFFECMKGTNFHNSAERLNDPVLIYNGRDAFTEEIEENHGLFSKIVLTEILNLNLLNASQTHYSERTKHVNHKAQSKNMLPASLIGSLRPSSNAAADAFCEATSYTRVS